VFFRSYQKAWAMESSLVAGGFLVVFVLNFVVLQNPHVYNRHRHESLVEAVKTELHSLARFKEKPHVLTMLISLFVLLLPQALLFNTRVFFLLASSEEGGLGCSVQDVGFAQGTIGVVAFFLGVIIGRAMMKKNGQSAMFWDTAVVLTLSPLSYWLMARNPQPDSLLLICCMTFFAQLCFGFGLNVCRPFIIYISEQRYRNTTNFLYVPLVASLMVVPMTLSGWLCTELGYQTFFLACAAIAPVAWILLVVCKTKSILFNE
jgi:PAT family beta-lactamase induction signal transducer AmpG